MGYDAGYYGYLWSEAYAHDIYSLFPKGAMDQEEELGLGLELEGEGETTEMREKKLAMGLRVRDTILSPGATKDGMEMLLDCLGRPPELKSYLASLKDHASY
jgi:Zn-dependent oligopeptidase